MAELKACVIIIKYAFSCAFCPDNEYDKKLEVTIELDNGDKCLITEMIKINICFKEMTPRKFWAWNESFVKVTYINLYFRFIIY